MTNSGDGFLKCSDGHVRWGLYGASGVVFVQHTGDAPLVMLQKRSVFSHEGGTWSCAGGALDKDEQPLEGALREAREEIGRVPVGTVLLGETVFAPAADWTYTTFVMQVEERFGESKNFETEAVAWLTPDEVEDRSMHAGFAAAWPELRRIIENSTASP